MGASMVEMGTNRTRVADPDQRPWVQVAAVGRSMDASMVEMGTNRARMDDPDQRPWGPGRRGRPLHERVHGGGGDEPDAYG